MDSDSRELLVHLYECIHTVFDKLVLSKKQKTNKNARYLSMKFTHLSFSLDTIPMCGERRKKLKIVGTKETQTK